MALINAEASAAGGQAARLIARARAWMASDHGAAQRMAGTAFIIRVVSAAIIFFLQVLLARWMGGFEFGIYVYVWTWLLVVSELVHLALPLAAGRFIPEYTQAKALDHLRGFLSGSRWLAFATATTTAALGAGCIWAIEPRLNPGTIAPLYVACICLPFYTLSMMCDGLARTYNWIGLALIPFAILRPILLVAVMAAMHVAGVMLDAKATMIAVAVTMAASTLLQIVMLDRRLASVVSAGPKVYDVPGWLKTSLPITAMWSFYTLLTYTDVLVLQQFRPPEEVAHYYAASKTLALVSFVYFSVATAAAHRFTTYHVAGELERLAEFIASSVRWVFWPSLAATLMILAFGKPMLWLFGPKFTEGYPFMFILAVGFIARASVGPAERLLNMLGEQRRCAMVYAVAFAVNVSGCLLLAGPYGGMGVAIATATSFVVELILLFVIVKRRLGVHMLIWPPAAAR